MYWVIGGLVATAVGGVVTKWVLDDRAKQRKASSRAAGKKHAKDQRNRRNREQAELDELAELLRRARAGR